MPHSCHAHRFAFFALITPLLGCAQDPIFADDFGRFLPPVAVTCPTLQGSSTTANLSSADPNGAALHEVSGLALSRRQLLDGAPVLWVHNDSGGGARFSAYSLVSGVRHKSFRLSAPGVDATDWEDIALGPCVDTADDCLYIANIGNNAAREVAPIGTQGRSVLEIYKLPEPDISLGADNQILKNAQVLSFRYGTGSPTATADAETLFVDATGDTAGGLAGDLYIVTKWNSAQASFRRVFKFSRAAQSTTIADLPALSTTFTGATQTRGDASAAGDLIVLGDYSNTRIYRRARAQTIELALGSAPCLTLGLPPGATQFQFEATGFNPAGTELIEISECTGVANCDPPIHRTRLNRPPPSQ